MSSLPLCSKLSFSLSYRYPPKPMKNGHSWSVIDILLHGWNNMSIFIKITNILLPLHSRSTVSPDYLFQSFHPLKRGPPTFFKSISCSDLTGFDHPASTVGQKWLPIEAWTWYWLPSFWSFLLSSIGHQISANSALVEFHVTSILHSGNVQCSFGGSHPKNTGLQVLPVLNRNFLKGRSIQSSLPKLYVHPAKRSLLTGSLLVVYLLHALLPTYSTVKRQTNTLCIYSTTTI